jgi:hypothetical protein
MTRRGTLAYYLAAWVVGCFVVAFLAWAFGAQRDASPTVSVLLILCFVALMYGAADILLFAFLLRRVMRVAGTHRIWLWMPAGAGLGALLVWLLLRAGDALVAYSPLSAGGPISFLLLVFWTAPNALRLAGLWLAPIAGAAIAAVLCLVDRAFNQDCRHDQETASESHPAQIAGRAP